MPDGEIADWDILEGGRTVAVVAIAMSGEIILIRIFRPGPEKVLLELPGGNVKSAEDIETAARRELVEETGYIPDRIKVVGQTWLASYATHQRFAVIATGCYRPSHPARPRVREDRLEFAATTLVSMRDFRLHVASGQLTDTDLAFMCLNHLDQHPELISDLQAEHIAN
jgi:ADP-ribose pyrophosphatase